MIDEKEISKIKDVFCAAVFIFSSKTWSSRCAQSVSKILSEGKISMEPSDISIDTQVVNENLQVQLRKYSQARIFFGFI